MTHRPLLGPIAFLACWAALSGGGGCSSPQPPPSACTIAVSASSGTFTYNLDVGAYLSAFNFHWTPGYSQGASPFRTAPEVVIGQAGWTHEVCIDGGHVEGPLPEDVVYECGDAGIHCPFGVCPDPCSEYHQTAAVEPQRAGTVMYGRVKWTNYGDGLSAAKTAEGGHFGVHESLLARLHDDAFECDYGCDASISESLLEDVNDVVALTPRDPPGGPEWRDMIGYRVEVLDSLVKLKTFPTTYKMVERGVGSLGLWKYAEGNCPGEHVVTGTTFAVQKLQQNDGLLFPPINAGLTSASSALLWYGSQADYNALLDSTSSASTRCDGLTNRERMEHLTGVACISGLPGCATWTVTVKPTGQTPNAFLAANWTPLADAWKLGHDADDQP